MGPFDLDVINNSAWVECLFLYELLPVGGKGIYTLLSATHFSPLLTPQPGHDG